MKKAKKLIPLLLCLCLILSGCAAREAEEKDSSKLQIVCTNFPAYDFAREIAGNRAQIKLLIKPGAEVHSYEPAPKEVIAIQASDLFICNGGESEAWVESLVGEDVNILRMMECVETVAESGEGIVLPSHPELAVKGSWSPDKMRDEIKRLNGLGLEVVPKLNFSATHDAWLKDYARMVSTQKYYEVVKDRHMFVRMGAQNSSPSLNKLPRVTCACAENGHLTSRNVNTFVQALHRCQNLQFPGCEIP